MTQGTPCKLCGEPIPEWRRSDAAFCSRRCSLRHWNCVTQGIPPVPSPVSALAPCVDCGVEVLGKERCRSCRRKVYRRTPSVQAYERAAEQRRRERDRQRRQDDPEYRAEVSRRRREQYGASPALRAATRAQDIRRKYGLTPEEYLAYLAEPCGICGSPSTCLDHCHDTGEVRGGLCDYCNLNVGRLETWFLSHQEQATKWVRKTRPDFLNRKEA